MILEIDSVELYFKDKRILNGIYLKAETGKVTGILGSNGCGKSCLINIIFGELKPKYKFLKIDNKPILKPLYLTNLASLLPQHNFAANTIKVKSIFKLLKVDWNEFISLFKSFSMHENLRMKKLSGGERRIIETYLILKQNTKIVLLDEPFSHIAPLYIETIKTLIKEEKQHKIIIITDHFYNDLIDISDTIYLLKNGCTKLIDDIKELEDYKYLSVGSLN